MKKRSFYFLLIFAALSILLQSCDDHGSHNTEPLIDSNNNGYPSKEVAEVIVYNCAVSGCHAGILPSGGLSLSTYDNMLRGSNARGFIGDTSHHNHKAGRSFASETVYGGEAFIAYNPGISLAMRLIMGDVADSSLRMPYKGSPLSEQQIALLRNWVENGLQNNKGEVPFSNPADPVIVCSQGSDMLYLLDPEKKVVHRTVSTDFIATKDAPHHVQIYGDYFYVTLISSGRFLKYNKNTLNLVAQTEGLTYPGMILLSGDGKTAYVSKSSSAAGSYSEIYIINTETMSLTGELTIPVAGIPHGTAIDRTTNKFFVANLTKDRISVFDLNTEELDGNDILLDTGNEPMHIYLSHNRAKLYVCSRKSNKFLVVDLSSRSVVQEIVFPSHPMQAAVAGDGRIYVNLMHSGQIAVLHDNGTTVTQTASVSDPGFTHLYGADLSEDGKYLYVTGSNEANTYKPRYAKPGGLQESTVSVINTSTLKVEKVLELGAYATGIAARR
ncbi:MAG: YncE family protein [Ignavibacteriaceae bacterium]|nr:YncE family protein [Ignavibacteriaceae bacterium]